MLPLGKREIEEQEVEKMLERGIIEPYQSAWSTPLVLVTKRDGSVRFCIDYRKLNECIIKDAYPLPCVDECFDALRGATWLNQSGRILYSVILLKSVTLQEILKLRFLVR